jgi:hypothetical protein
MIRNASIFVFVMTSSLLASTGAAWAGDPTQIGKHVENIISPNVKSFWKIALVVGILATCFGRLKASLLVAFWVSIVVAGMVIYNPSDVASTVSDMGKKVL